MPTDQCCGTKLILGVFRNEADDREHRRNQGSQQPFLMHNFDSYIFLCHSSTPRFLGRGHADAVKPNTAAGSIAGSSTFARVRHALASGVARLAG